MVDLINRYRQFDAELSALKLNKHICQREMRHWGATTLIDYRAYLGKKYDMFTRLQQTKRIGDEIVEINNRIDELNHYMKLIREVVDKFDGLEYQILKYKYMDGMTLSEVAAKVNRSDQYIRNKHAEIIKRIEFVG